MVYDVVLGRLEVVSHILLSVETTYDYINVEIFYVFPEYVEMLFLPKRPRRVAGC